jgi:MarR family transcriptional regulator, organic hydroperoxide resistance regulator
MREGRGGTSMEGRLKEDTGRNRPGKVPVPPLGEALEFLRLMWAIDHGLQSQSKRMATTLGVTGPQRLAIRIVGRFPGISAGQLAHILQLHPSTLTGILRRLERRGLVTRRSDPQDGRRALLSLSPPGRRLDVDVSGTVESEARTVLAGLRPSDVRAARRVLLALTERLCPLPSGARQPVRRPR